MNNSILEAAEHLKTIRSLMERATVYRAISGTAALVAGGLAIGLCLWQAWRYQDGGLSPWVFTGQWLIILAVVTLLNLILLFNGAKQRQEAFVSSGMKMALQAIAPPLLAGGILGHASIRGEATDFSNIVTSWIVCYGLALLAMSPFAPRSLVLLGRAFFIAGIISWIPQIRSLWGSPSHMALLWMGLSFGLCHVVYGLHCLRGTESAHRLGL